MGDFCDIFKLNIYQLAKVKYAYVAQLDRAVPS